ncbi:MAG: YbaB/EbfC family nucleoid-associated protein [Candidatus Roizmanbacteria bacterium]|nr:YbaB/EbfC family nucleoid-associated protein [Candidatus Roizmanbacteria bacterium]
MFGKLGEMKQMYDKYKKLQEALQKIIIRARENGIIIDMTAEQKVKSVQIEDTELLNPEHKEVLEKALKVAFEKAQAKAQEVAMQKTKDILGFDPNDLASMMAGGNMPKLG